MIRSVALCLLTFCFVAAGSTFAQSSSEWKDFESKDGSFRAVFPAAPQLSVSEIDEPAGKRRVQWAEVRTNTYYFAVSYSDYPVKSMERNSLKENYDFMEKQIAGGFGGKQAASRDVAAGGHQGRELVLEKLGERVVHRTFIVGKRVYFNIVVMRIADFERPEMAAMSKKFFESFMITSSQKK